jgi:hypothetical protein
LFLLSRYCDDARGSPENVEWVTEFTDRRSKAVTVQRIAAREQIAAGRDECRQFDYAIANVEPVAGSVGQAGNPMLQIRLGDA